MDPQEAAYNSTALSFAQWFLSAIGGALVVLVAFRTKIALMDKRIQERKDEIMRLERDLTQRLDAIDRRQGLILEIVADVARKVGADARFSDAVVRFLSEELRTDRPAPPRDARDSRDSRDDQIRSS
jgi:hypothetical protein